MEPTKLSLPENAYRELKPGEEYQPVVPEGAGFREVSFYSVFWGLVYAVLFSAAAAYLGLKIGQVFEAAIPIAILAAGYTAFTKRKNSLLENVLVQSIGAASGVIVAGAIFTIPGLYILEVEASFFQIFMASLLGGIIGVLFLIPFRQYFVKEMHGQFPFPEATATTEVLVSGEAGGNQAKVLLSAAVIGGLYDFMISGFGLWKEVVSTEVFSWGQALSDKVKMVYKMNVGAAVMGLGYIIGLKYALIIAAGSFVAWWVFIPLVYFVGQFNPEPILNATIPISQMSPDQIFGEYVRHIGIGGIAAAGIIGIIKSWRIIAGAMKLAYDEIFGGKLAHAENNVKKTSLDIKMKYIVIGLIVSFVVMFLFFLFGVVENNVFHAVVGLLIVLIIAFLFTTVAARAIAIVGTNPVSGMTLMTLIISAFILVQIGLTGTKGMLAALIIGGVVCTALSVAGGFITDLKIGYWTGMTPRTQERFKFLGILVSAAVVAVVIKILSVTYGFGSPTDAHPNPLEAPQASAMAAVLKPLMSNQPAPWLAYLAGIMFAIILEFLGVPPLAFALGMYLPMHLNTPILIGGLIAHFTSKRSKDNALNNARRERGTLIASGFIAGGAIMGVLAAFITFFGREVFKLAPNWSLKLALGTEHWEASSGGEILGFVMFAVLCCYMIWDTLRAKKEA
ncbi:MAG: oligopeptide transporter, OPT family [Calditrichia bacterium]